MRGLAGSSVLRDRFLVPVQALLFPSYAPRCRYDVLGVLASGSGLAVSA